MRTTDRQDRQSYTLVSFHAHPDDESLLTGGTLAKAADEGHRVTLVTATDGCRGLAGPRDGTGRRLAARRLTELERAGRLLGCHGVTALGYEDSGLTPDSDAVRAFARADVEEAASRLADILVGEHADVLTIYDRHGGYGHPDHVQVHHVGMRAAELAGTPVVLEATVPADLLRGVLRLARLVGHPLGQPPPLGEASIFAARHELTHQVRVDGFLHAKRAAMSAHASQRRSSGERRTLDRLVRLPTPLFALLFGREWFIEQGKRPGHLESDIFATLRLRGAGL